MAADTRSQVLPESAFAEWDRLVAASPDGSIYSQPAYLDALCSAAGGRFRILAVRRGDELAGGVALYERSAAFGRYVAPRLLLYYNGLVLRRYDTKYPSERTARMTKTAAALEEFLSAARLGGITLRSRSTVTDVRPFLVAGWTSQASYSYVVALDDLKAQWNLVEQNLRRLVERCSDQGVTATEDDDFDSFYRLHRATMDRRELGTYLPQAAFAEFFRRLRGQGLCRLFQARLADGRVIATQLVLLGAHRISHTVSAAGDPEFGKLGAAAFLRWRAFEALSALGYAGNDLTDASLNPVTHFKSQFGGDLGLSLVLQSPGTRRYRWGTSAVARYWRAREVAARALHGVLHRGRP